ncbi:MAG: adenosylcobalamin-dependent ribonucleoside-diphosphate reductase [Candidatus Abawacabacteria bacterium]|nr:adenosylcobalamin-dependent ribonucleoside-diphosphate reductase [Candidatus Abawacabacteria bacterium]
MPQITQLKKRDNTIVAYKISKIAEAIFKAAQAVGGHDHKESEHLAVLVEKALNEKFKPTSIPSVEEVQDLVEKVLIEEGHAKTAKAYILYREKRRQAREEQMAVMNGFTTKLPFSMNALRVIAKRYLVRDDKGEISESPEGMFARVAVSLAKIEKNYGKNEKQTKEIEKQFSEILTNFEFTPAGRTLANAGAPTPLISNCIVLHMEDSMAGIFKTLRDAALLQKAGSGLGFPFHLLRPAGSFCVSSRGQAGGPVSFLHVYNEAFGVIKQQGRHGANMAVMRVDHPDILEFIHCKSVEGKIKNFNISVGMTDEFMEAIRSESKEPWFCQFEGVKMKPRRVYRNKDMVIEKIEEETMTATELLHEIVSAAWHNGEPGIVFLDAVNKTNPVPGLGSIEACNPCGEQFLHANDVCNLGSINLERFVLDGQINLERLKAVTKISIRLLENVIDLTDFPVEDVNKTFRGNRRIGLGIMGFADMLYQLGIAYNSEEGIRTAELVMSTIQQAAHEMSQELAEERGAFPNYDLSIYKKQGIKMRNAALTTIAPTGSISMIYDVSSGVEPYFALSYFKENIMGGDSLYYGNRHLEKVLKDRGIYSQELMKKIAEHGTIQDLAEIPEDIKRVFVTAMDISAEDHIRMQAAFQKHIDNSISKTINFANSASKEDVMKGYLLAWELGCKGCTVYRSGSRELEILSVSSKKQNKETESKEINDEKMNINLEVKKIATLSKAELMKEGICPDCGGKLVKEEGCAKCHNCAFSVCAL